MTMTMTLTMRVFRLRRWWRRRRAADAHRVHEPAPAIEVAERPLGPGWFDSSWDLHCGLDVREGLPGNASVNEWLLAALAPSAR